MKDEEDYAMMVRFTSSFTINVSSYVNEMPLLPR